ncbi:FAD-dependent oxidoreductase [Leucobacter tenebrionis]|uniref:FAD-dependent oxidoreductase n=1 Tax=Leucobacter tenebrionis TaxID=2873270 RepID=UPI001CA64149|nr:FAD-dependent oxidoreductase [Leucobacter tenebrionis]QZY51059.1 FAD-dependent oxidoreductase [Leucobacter tenebrionis]
MGREKQCEEFDVVVIGAGAGGLATAVTTAHRGLRVLVLERDRRCGGATSRSGGWLWAPRNEFARADGVDESIDDIKQYLRAVTGENYDEARTDAFLRAAPEMVSFFEHETFLQFVPGSKICDIYGGLPHAGTGHRSVAPKPVSGRVFPKQLRRMMAPQFWETSFLGMGIMAGPDLSGFLAASKLKPAGWWHAAKRVTRYVFDVLTEGRGMHFVNGVALTGRLMKSAVDRGVDIRVRHRAIEITRASDGRANGVVAETPRGRRRFRAARGVVIASGGFSANAAMRVGHFPHNRSADDHWTLAPRTADGSGIELGRSLGGVLDTSGASPAAWCPVSLVPYANGRTGVFPHIMDRAKPGSIGVRRDGRRFVNEANGYWDYVSGLNSATPEGELAEAWQIGDSRFLAHYPLGFAMPRPVPKWPHLRSGYLVRADTLPELAERCGIDAAQLVATVEKFNRGARRGEDPEFHRGETPFNRYGGDPEVGPNPSLAPIERGPFYAVRVMQGSFGTFAGLRTDERARLLDERGEHIPGAYVVGVDQKNLFGGHYPAGGINIGPALTFGYIAGLDLAEATPAPAR